MRVTIGQLTEDLTPFTKQGDEAMNIEIVPRKIVEDIIEICLSAGEQEYDYGIEKYKEHYHTNGVIHIAKSQAYEHIATIAHEFLDFFEGEDDERNNHNR